MKKLLKTFLLAVCLLVGGTNSAWAGTETLGEGQTASNNAAIIGTAVTIAGTSNPGGIGSYAVFDSKSDKGIKLRTNVPLTINVNTGYKITGVIVYAYQNNESTQTISCDSYSVDGAATTNFSPVISIPYNVKNASTQTLATISTGEIDARTSIVFNFSNSGSGQNQIYAFLEITYEEIQNTVYSKTLSGWTSSDVTKTEGTLNKWYNSTGIVKNDYLTGMMIDATYGLRLAARNTTATATLKYSHTTNSIVTIDAVWNVGSASSDGNTPHNKFQFGDLTIQQNVRSNNLTTTYTINGSTKTVGTDKFAREDEMTIHLKVNSYTGNILEFSLKNGETEVASFSELTSTTNHFAAGSKYDEVTMTSWISASSSYAWCALKSITVKEQEQAIYSYTVKGKTGGTTLKTLATGDQLIGSKIYYHYNQVLNNNGTLYTAASDNNEYKSNFTLESNNQEVVKAYSQPATPITNLMFLAEGEDLFTEGTGSSADTRLSMGAGGYSTSKTAFVRLPAGDYTLVLTNRCSGTKTGMHKFYKGDDADPFYEADGNGYNAERSSNFTLTETTTISENGGDKNNLIDWIYIYGTPTNDIIGQTDNSTTYLSDMTDKVTLKPGESYSYSFVNYNGETNAWNNWVLPVYDSNDNNKIVIRADNWEDKAVANTGFTSSGFDWSNFVAKLNGATINMTVSFTKEKVFTMSCTITPSDASSDWTYSYTSDYTGSTFDFTSDGFIKVALSVSNSWAEVVSEGYTTLAPTITAVNYGTYSSDYALDFEHATGVQAYYSKATSDGKIIMTKVNEAVRAGEGLFIEKIDGDVSIPVVASGATLTGNKLKAGGVEAPADSYVFANQGGVLGFYKLTSATNIPKGKAYLEAGSYGARLSIMFDDETTGISELKQAEQMNLNETVYNLRGQRVAQPQKGLFIVNGHKVVIK